MKPALLLPVPLGVTLALAACGNGPSAPGLAHVPAATIAAPMDPNATLLPLDDPSGFQGGQPSTGVGMPSAPNGVGTPSLHDED